MKYEFTFSGTITIISDSQDDAFSKADALLGVNHKKIVSDPACTDYALDNIECVDILDE